MFKSEFGIEEELSDFCRVMATNKITYEFRINADEKDRFFYWINVLSSVEFKVDVDLDNIQMKRSSITQNKQKEEFILFRIKVSGEEEDLKRWINNLKCVSNFLNGDFNISYIKKEHNSNAN